MITLVKVDTDWVEQEPVEGDWIKEVFDTGASVERRYSIPEGIRKITKRAFMQRYTQVERIAMRNSTDDIVIDILEDLASATNVRLDLPDVEASIDYLISAGLLDAVRKDSILADGTEDEV